MSDGEPKEILPASTNTERALDVSATLVSAAPYLGGPLSSVLAGMANARRMDRVKDVLEQLAEDLRGFKSDVSEQYVSRDEFEDLLDNTLRAAANERNDEKRRVYAAFLSHTIKSPGDPYDDQARLLHLLESLHPDHIRVIRALIQAPEPNPGMIGSPLRTIMHRAPELADDRVRAVVAELDNLNITRLREGLVVNMTGDGAADLRNRLTALGTQLVAYIQGR